MGVSRINKKFKIFTLLKKNFTVAFKQEFRIYRIFRKNF